MSNDSGIVNGWFNGLQTPNAGSSNRILRRRNSAFRLELFFNSERLNFVIQVENEKIYGIQLAETINFNPNRAIMLSVMWAEYGRTQKIFLNGVEQYVQVLDNPDFPVYSEPISTFNRSRLFLSTMNDLRCKLELNDEYYLLKATELMRGLLFDEYGSLVDIIIQKTNFKRELKFRHGVISRQPQSIYSDFDVLVLGDAISPDNIISGGIEVRESNKEDFLNSSIIQVSGDEISVMNILKFVLYKLGGTHQVNVGSKGDVKKKVPLIEQFQRDTMNDMSAIINLVIPIGKVIVSALRDLEEHVKNYDS